MFSASSLVQQLSVSSSEDRGRKKKKASILSILFGVHFLTHPPPAQIPHTGWASTGHLGSSSDSGSLLFLFSLLYYSPLNFKLNGTADGHMSTEVSQNTHFS